MNALSNRRGRTACTTLTLLVTFAACDGSRASFPVTPSPASLTTIVFDRDNTLGGTDLYRAPLDASQPPVNLTRHDFQRVAQVWPDRVDGRIVYTADAGSNRDFYSVRADEPAGSTPGYRRLTAQSLGTPAPEDWGVVGSRIVVLATVAGVDNLFAIPVDGSALTQLTNFTAGTIEWPRNDDLQRNAVTTGGQVIFEHTDGGRTTVYGVAATGASGSQRALTNADQSSLVIDRYGWPMIDGNTVVIRESTPTATVFRAVDVSTNGPGRVLTPALPSYQSVAAALLFANHFVYVLADQNADVQSVVSIALDGPTGAGGQPLVNTLTPSLNQGGTHVLDLAVVPGTDQLVVVAEQPGAVATSVYCDVYGVRLDQPQSLLRLTQPRDVNANDIGELVVCGSAALFERASTPNAVWFVDLDRPGSEVVALPSQQGNLVEVDQSIFTGLTLRAVTGVVTTPPTARRVERVVLTATTMGTSGAFTNFFAVKADGNGLEVKQLSGQFVVPDGTPPTAIEVQKGDWIAYRRSGLLFASRSTAAQSELAILSSAVTITTLFGRAGQGAADRVFFAANDQLFSTRVSVAATTPGSTRQLSALPPGQAVDEILFNTDDRIVYTVTGLGRTTIVSSPVAPAAPQIDDVSRSISLADRFQIAY